MKVLKKITAVTLVMALALSLAQIVAPQAEAATKKITLIKGEAVSITVYGSTIKSVKSSKSSVVKVKKSSKNKATVTAKKKGTATVTIKGKNGKSLKYKFTVKNVKLDVSVVDINNVQAYSTSVYSYITFKVTNKTGVYLANAKVAYALYDNTGVAVENNDGFTVYALPNKASTYYTVKYYYGAITDAVGVARATSSSHSISYKYTSISSKITIKEKSIDGTTYTFSVKNASKQSSSGYADVAFYDENGKILAVNQLSLSVNKKSTDTKRVYGPTGAVSYKILGKRAVYSKYVSV